MTFEELPDWQQRFVLEYKELLEKLLNLAICWIIGIISILHQNVVKVFCLHSIIR